MNPKCFNILGKNTNFSIVTWICPDFSNCKRVVVVRIIVVPVHTSLWSPCRERPGREGDDRIGQNWTNSSTLIIDRGFPYQFKIYGWRSTTVCVKIMRSLEDKMLTYNVCPLNTTVLPLVIRECSRFSKFRAGKIEVRLDELL